MVEEVACTTPQHVQANKVDNDEASNRDVLADHNLVSRSEGVLCKATKEYVVECSNQQPAGKDCENQNQQSNVSVEMSLALT